MIGAGESPPDGAPEATGRAVPDPVRARAFDPERARRLGRHVRVPVVLDQGGSLRGDVELVYQGNRRGHIRPVEVRIGRDAMDNDVLNEDGPLTLCRRYNDALKTLQDLAARLERQVQDARLIVEPDTQLAIAYRELSRLDHLIATRQALPMGHGVVRMEALRREIEFCVRLEAQHAPVVLAAERTAKASRRRTSLRQPVAFPVPLRRWVKR
jgi:hypothetical protein